jgi:RHS repeat-associated protein
MLSSDSTDYLLGGRLIMKNGNIDKFLFEGGYAQAIPVDDGSAAKAMSLWLEDDDNSTSSGSSNSNNAQESMHTKDAFDFYYYNQDHLGNNREVVDAKGVVQQVTNYYPFGAPYADATAVKGANLQPYKYNGKELDLMHGLNTFDYGARQHDPILCRWDRIDLLCEADYGVSPYSYCNNSPINAVDPDGNFTVFINEFRPWAWDIAYKNAL